jgi:glycosyltransferase involved in cell wall biosynthesis
MRVAAGGGRRLRAINVPIDGVELSAFDPPLPPCDQVLNAHGLFERAHWSFAVRRRFTELKLPGGALKVAHWTWPLAVKARDVPNIYTLHDLVPLQFPHFSLDRRGRSTLLHAAIARQADHIITVSEISKRKIVELLKVEEDRISVTYQPVPELPRIARANAERLVESVYGVEPGKYALFVGAIEPKKNLKRLIEAFLLAGLDIPLLIAGPLGWLYDDDIALIDVIAGHVNGSAIAAEAPAPVAPPSAPVLTIRSRTK